MHFLTRITQQPDATCAWTLVNRHQVTVDRDQGYTTHRAAEQAAVASRRRPQRSMASQLRDDGEDITGYWDVDLDRSR